MATRDGFKATESLSSAINDMIDNKFNNINRDRTRAGRVQSVNVDGTYNVFIDGKIYNNVKKYGDGDIVANAIVKVIYPDNKSSNMYILPPNLIATTTTNGLITPDEKFKLKNILYDGDGVLNITVGSGKNYSTIQEAIDSLPKNLNNTSVSIIIDSGTFNENVEIKDFYGNGSLQLIGNGGVEGSYTTTVNTFYCMDCRVKISLNSFLTNGYLVFLTGSYCGNIFSNCQYVALDYINITNTSLTNPTGTAIMSDKSNLYCFNCNTGSAYIGVRSRYNSVVYWGSTSTYGTSTISARAELGGILSGQNKATDYDVLVGGLVSTGSGFKGETITITDGTVCSWSGICTAYRPMGLCYLSGSLTVKTGRSIAADTNVLVCSISTSGMTEATPVFITPFAVTRAMNAYIRSFINTSGDIYIRSGASISASGTMYISGFYPIARG